jgi:ubiquitin carboxyl-terminal hydrolase 34
MIFDKLENSLKPTPFKTFLDSVYGGKTVNMMRCTGCDYVRNIEQMFYNLSLEVKNLKNLREGFEKFNQEEFISDYKCDNCDQRCDIVKRQFLHTLPNVFIIHL